MLFGMRTRENGMWYVGGVASNMGVVCGRCGLLYTVIWVWHVLYSNLVLYSSMSKQQFALFRTLL